MQTTGKTESFQKIEWLVCIDCQMVFKKYKNNHLITRCPNCKSNYLEQIGTKFHPTKDIYINPSEREE